MTTWTTDGDPWTTDGVEWTTGEEFDPANSYLIFRRTPPTGEPFDPEVDTPIAEVPPEQLTYDDENLGDAEYEYQVIARKAE